MIVAYEEGRVVGYASTSRFRPKPAYDTTVESSVYCRADTLGRGVGTLLYRSLFEAIAGEDIRQIVAGVALPNPSSVALHERVGFRRSACSRASDGSSIATGMSPGTRGR